MQVSEWVLIGTTLLLAAVAFIAPYAVEKWKHKFYSAKLNFKFIHIPPYSHITEMRGAGFSSSVYYFRLKIVNDGKVQAEQCEVVLEKIWKKNDSGELVELSGFSPVSLKWSSPSMEKYPTIQPGREIFCNIGSIYPPDYQPVSQYRSITDEQNRENKFFLEIYERYYAQWDCLVPGKYQIELAIYSKNTNKISKRFKIIWTGVWKDEEDEMLDELVIF